MYQTKLFKFDRDYKNEIQFNFFGMYPYQIANIPVKYENSNILKMTVNFHIDRYSSGRSSSYDKYRRRNNNKVPTSNAGGAAASVVANSDNDVFAGFNQGATDPDTLTYSSFDS